MLFKAHERTSQRYDLMSVVSMLARVKRFPIILFLRLVWPIQSFVRPAYSNGLIMIIPGES
jgi:hypothetical protein